MSNDDALRSGKQASILFSHLDNMLDPPSKPLFAIRERSGMTQQQMAAALDISLRAYQDQEASDTPRQAYLLAAERICDRITLEAVDVTKPLPSYIDELKAQNQAAHYHIADLFEILSSIASAHGKPIDFEKLAKRARNRAAHSSDPRRDLILRRQVELMARNYQFQWL
jgi:transcriptional regulator with XRE-family HTH domain